MKRNIYDVQPTRFDFATFFFNMLKSKCRSFFWGCSVKRFYRRTDNKIAENKNSVKWRNT